MTKQQVDLIMSAILDSPVDTSKQLQDEAYKVLCKSIAEKRVEGWYGEATECPNCHKVASGAYCSWCGQQLQ